MQRIAPFSVSVHLNPWSHLCSQLDQASITMIKCKSNDWTPEEESSQWQRCVKEPRLETAGLSELIWTHLESISLIRGVRRGRNCLWAPPVSSPPHPTPHQAAKKDFTTELRMSRHLQCSAAWCLSCLTGWISAQVLGRSHTFVSEVSTSWAAAPLLLQQRYYSTSTWLGRM